MLRYDDQEWSLCMDLEIVRFYLVSKVVIRNIRVFFAYVIYERKRNFGNSNSSKKKFGEKYILYQPFTD